ncbi:MAG: hypothetical protein HY369_04245 [Candidatus Aenigmarchaeota archaeon]|nr:hypothetical protein [Candidatus Aenigmarchaeota archaeon]
MASTPLVALVVIVGAGLVALGLGGNLLPAFTAADPCAKAQVLIHAASYTDGSITVDVENRGGTDLALVSYVTRGNDVQKLDHTVFLSSGARDTFTIDNVGSKPDQFTMRDETCGTADLSYL